MFTTIEYHNDKIRMIDQRRLPHSEVYQEYKDYREVAVAIKDMVVRGAPAIGIAAAMGIVLGANSIKASSYPEFEKAMEPVFSCIASSRPTAVNLFWAVERMKRRLRENKDKDIEIIKDILKKEAIAILEEDISINKEIGKNGNQLIKDGDTILTHCNAGALATGGYGTALGVIRAAWSSNKKITVYADETRPFLQGARLTSWELVKENIPVYLITDNMAGHFMAKRDIDVVIVGADRIAGNGDVANKIGTYSIAVLAKEHNIPFYVAAPISTFDFSLSSGSEIPIEERNIEEVTNIDGKRVAPYGISVKNPAFDVTPARYVTSIITEKGIVNEPFIENIKALRPK